MAEAVGPGGHRQQVWAVREEDLDDGDAVCQEHKEVGTAERDQQLVENVGSHAPVMRHEVDKHCLRGSLTCVAAS